MNLHERIRELFAQALQRSAPAEREAYLEEACRGDADVRREVDSLLEAHQRAGEFLRRDDPNFLVQDHPEEVSLRTRRAHAREQAALEELQ